MAKKIKWAVQKQGQLFACLFIDMLKPAVTLCTLMCLSAVISFHRVLPHPLLCWRSPLFPPLAGSHSCRNKLPVSIGISLRIKWFKRIPSFLLQLKTGAQRFYSMHFFSSYIHNLWRRSFFEMRCKSLLDLSCKLYNCACTNQRADDHKYSLITT